MLRWTNNQGEFDLWVKSGWIILFLFRSIITYRSLHPPKPDWTDKEDAWQSLYCVGNHILFVDMEVGSWRQTFVIFFMSFDEFAESWGTMRRKSCRKSWEVCGRNSASMLQQCRLFPCTIRWFSGILSASSCRTRLIFWCRCVLYTLDSGGKLLSQWSLAPDEIFVQC